LLQANYLEVICVYWIS